MYGLMSEYAQIKDKYRPTITSVSINYVQSKIRTSEKFVTTYNTTGCHKPE
jgi:hypothetical protein